MTSINAGAVPSNTGGGPLDGWISKVSDSLIVGILWPLVHLLSLIAMSIMWLMTGIQQILYTIEIATSPIFIGMLMVPRLVGTATRFFTSLVAICIWPMGWTVTDLLTRALIDIAVNPTNNVAQSAFANGTMMLGYWVLVAVWVILSSFAAPIVIGHEHSWLAAAGLRPCLVEPSGRWLCVLAAPAYKRLRWQRGQLLLRSQSLLQA